MNLAAVKLAREVADEFSTPDKPRFGGKKIPELMRGLGKGVKSFKDGVNEAKEEINKAKDEIDAPADSAKK